MALRNIITIGDDILTKKTRLVEQVDDRIKALIEDMFETLEQSGGVGLAAPQVGMLKSLAIIDVFLPEIETAAEMTELPGHDVAADTEAIEQTDDSEHTATEEEPKLVRHSYILINPKVISQEGEIEDEEGCLSVPDKVGTVIRPETITVSSLDLDGKEVEYTVSGFVARAFCHELDHLDGILYTDKALAVRDVSSGEDEEA
jgi:peptide deformylase